MMPNLSQLFASSARTEILETLFRQPGELGLRQTARIAGLQIRSAQLALEGLHAERLIRRRKAGARVYVSLNREHPAFGLLSDVFDATERHRIRTQAAAYQSSGREIMKFVIPALRMLNRARRSRHGT